MSESKLLTVKLSSQDYHRLGKEAQRLNLPINILAQKLLKFSLEKIPPQFDKQKAREAIFGFQEIGKNLSKKLGRATPPFKAKSFWSVALIPVTKTNFDFLLLTSDF